MLNSIVEASSGTFSGIGFDGLSNCNWYSKSSQIVSIPLVPVNTLFKINFRISLNYQSERIVLGNVQIICHPLTSSPTTQIPTGIICIYFAAKQNIMFFNDRDRD